MVPAFLVSSIIPLHRVEAGSFFDAIAGVFKGVDSFASKSTRPEEKNSQTMLVASAPFNTKLGGESEDIASIADIEGSAISATLSVSPISGEDKPKQTISTDQISVYIVHDGDTLSEVATMFGVSSNTVRWANDIPKGGALKTGQKLVILPVSGIQYTIKKGDTLAKIAKNYSADADDIREVNSIDDSSITVGDSIIIPNGIETPAPIVAPIKKFIARIISTSVDVGIQTNGYFMRPTSAPKTQGIHGHNGIDFSGRGDPSVVAAASGKVLISLSSGYNGGYGSYIVISHSNGTQTLYAHLSANFVSAGDTVTQGQTIGTIGNTGRSTGPHLHFEVRGGRNPF